MTAVNNFRRSPGVKNFATVLLTKKYWWAHFAVVALISIVGLVALGTWTYAGAPPVVDFVSATSGKTVIATQEIVSGKKLFHIRGLMTWGSFWGDGAERGPDFTADALHRTVVAMRSFYKREIAARRPVTQADEDGIAMRVQREIHENNYAKSAGQIRLNDAQVYAYRELQKHYTRMFTDPTYPEKFRTPGYIGVFLLGRLGLRSQSAGRDVQLHPQLALRSGSRQHAHAHDPDVERPFDSGAVRDHGDRAVRVRPDENIAGRSVRDEW